jgi:hypothetical protein
MTTQSDGTHRRFRVSKHCPFTVEGQCFDMQEREHTTGSREKHWKRQAPLEAEISTVRRSQHRKRTLWIEH